MTPPLLDRAAKARSLEPPWSAERAARVRNRIVRARAIAARRTLAFEVVGAVLIGLCLALLMVRVAAGRSERGPEAGSAAPSIPAAEERMALADGALGDGGYEASLR